MNSLKINSNNNNISFNGGKNRLAKVITGMTKGDALEPVIALEGCVVTGRTYQAYQRGKWDEARERFIEEIMGSITWLGGVWSLNWLGDKVVAKIMKSNGKNFDVGKDSLRTPFDNFMKKIAPKKFSQTQVACIKSAKVLTSIVLANLFIGFVVPKVNQGLTKKIRHERKIEQEQQKLLAPKTPAKETSFKGGMNFVNGFTNIIENTNAGKLLSSDAGIVTGRMYNARRPEERREIAIRDIGSIYFYMWASGHVGNLLNLIESGSPTRLNPNTVLILDKHLQDYLGDKSMDVNEFREAILGKPNEVKISNKINFESEPVSGLAKLMNKKPLKTIKLSELEGINDIPQDVLERARQMAELQPERIIEADGKLVGEKILTMQQVFDAYNKAEINNVKLLHNVFSEYTGGVGKEIGKNANGKAILSEFEFEGGKYNDEYRYVSNKKLYSLKSQMEKYIETICKEAKGGKIDKKLLEKVKNKNIIFSGINFAAGFTVAATFLSTLIPKFQYYVTRKATGVDAFPGTYDYEKHREEDD